MPPTAAALAVANTLLAAALGAQGLTGTVRGFHGEPAACAVVRAFGQSGAPLVEVLTDEAGRFELATDIAPAWLELQLEGVAFSRRVQPAEHDVTATFAEVACFTLEGHVVDPGGAVASHVDLMLRSAGDTITTVTTDDRGAYRVRCNRTVTDIVVDPLGWQHCESGAWDADRGVAIDLRLSRDAFFCIDGTARDGERVLAGARVVGYLDRTRAVRAQVTRDGRFELWSNAPIVEIDVLAGTQRLHQFGPWPRAATLELSEARHGLVNVTGRMLDRDGAPVGGALLLPARTEERPGRPRLILGQTGANGDFSVFVPRSTPFLCAFDVASPDRTIAFAKGPFDGAQVVELREGK